MSEGPRSSKLMSLLKAGTASISLLLAACATPVTQGPRIERADAEAAKQRQQEARASGRKIEAPDSPYINFPMEQRLANVANRIFVAAAPYCSKTKLTYNVGLGTPDGGQPVIMDAQAPLQPGDRLVGVNGARVGAGAAGRNAYLDARDRSAPYGQNISLDVLRSGQRVTAQLAPVKACDYAVAIIPGNQPIGQVFNAYADGQKVHISPVVMQKLRNDADLGFVMSHELAHNSMGHMDSKLTNARIGAGLGVVADLAIGILSKGQIKTQGAATQAGITMGATSYSVDFEREADYVGTYINTRAGYDAAAGQRVADRMAMQSKSPDSIQYSSSHPATMDRAAAADATADEIADKKARGQLLAPNLKGGKTLKIN